MAKRVAKKAVKTAKVKSMPAKKVKKKSLKISAEAKVEKVKKVEKEQKVTEAEILREVKAKVLSVDDEEVIRTLLKKILTKAGYEVKLAASGEEGIRAMKKEEFDLCIIDLKMPGMGGMAFLAQMKEHYPDTEAVILTAFGDIDTAVGAMKKGAFNFVPKPFKKDIFLAIIERAIERKVMKKDFEGMKSAMREMENETSVRIGELEGQLLAVEEAKRELGDQFNAIKQSLIEGTGKHGGLEKNVIALEKVAGQIKEMEERLVMAEEEKKEVLKKTKRLEKELVLKVSSNVELGNKLEETKTSLEDLKEEVAKHKKAAPSEKEAKLKISLSDIHRTLAGFKKEIENE